jgi:hypothetical protein
MADKIQQKSDTVYGTRYIFRNAIAVYEHAVPRQRNVKGNTSVWQRRVGQSVWL